MSGAFTDRAFADHFSAAAADYASARPEYPAALFDWITRTAPARSRVWEAGCGSGQASRALAARFAQVYATDPSAAQIAQARAPGNVRFAVEPAERCSLADASADVVCVAQALHWFDRDAFFAECERVLRPGGALVVWGYQDIEVPGPLQPANDALQALIRDDWPPERADVDAAYAGYAWPFEPLSAPSFELQAAWILPRLLAYFSSYSASKQHRERTGIDPVTVHAAEWLRTWGDPEATRIVRWPLFVHARRKP